MNDANDQAPSRRLLNRPGRDSGLVLAAGVLVTAGLPPFRWTWPLVIVGLAMLFVVLARSERPGRSAWLFGLAHQTTLLHWLFLLDPSKSIPTRALVPIQAAATILYVSVFYLLLGWAFGRLRGRLGAGRVLLLLPVLWAVVEVMRTRGELAFSWCLVGSAVIGSPLMKLARAAGEQGVGVALVFAAVLLAFAARRAMVVRSHGVALAVAVVACWGALLIGSFLTPHPSGEGSDTPPVSLQVAAIQADVALRDKWRDGKIDSTKIPYEALTRQAADEGADFVVWAETAVPAYLRLDADLMAWVRDLVREAGVHLYTGFPDADRGPDGGVRTYNSSGLFDVRGMLVDTYAKYHLLPIGEAMPFTTVLPFLAGIDVGQAEWTPGAPPAPMVVPTPNGEFSFSGLVCFESIFSWLARRSVQAGSRCLVVITNDGWFGKSAGPRQHSDMARMRAVECGVPVIRAANNGVSFICDVDGRLVEQLDLGRRGIVSAQVTAGSGRTLYVRYGTAPLFWFLLAWTFAVLTLPRDNLNTPEGHGS